MIPVIRSFLPTTNLESFFDSNPYLILIEEFPSKSRNCFLFLRKSVCPDSTLRLIWIRDPGGCPSRDLSGGWWLLSLLDRILSHKPPWISLDVFLRQQRRWYGRDLRLCLDFLVVTLTSWVLDNPSLLVYRVVDKRRYDLPSLFTVLSMTNALSIHAHPSTVLAETLHREDPFNYRDANHKHAIALTVTHSHALWDFVTLTLSKKACLVSEQENQYTGVVLQPLHCCYAHTKAIQVLFDCDSIGCVVDLWLHQSGFLGIAMSRLLVGSAMYRWESLVTMDWETWDGLVVEIYKGAVFHNDIGTEVLVPLYLHFRFRFEHIGFHATFCEKKFSHKVLHTNRNKEKSNMKLDNNGSSGRLASKATLRKASSNSLLLYFLLVYGAYICVCNNCVSLFLYVFVITLLD